MLAVLRATTPAAPPCPAASLVRTVLVKNLLGSNSKSSLKPRSSPVSTCRGARARACVRVRKLVRSTTAARAAQAATAAARMSASWFST